MKRSKLLLKFLHTLLLLACFLPAIVPSCGGKNDKTATIDFTATVIEAPVDTTISKDFQPADSSKINNVVPDENEKNVNDSTTVQKFISVLLQPDGENLSILSFTYFYFTNSCIIIFFLISSFSTWMSFRSNDNVAFEFKIALIAFVSITIFVLDNSTDVIWGFWIVYTLSTLILIERLIAKIYSNKKS